MTQQGGPVAQIVLHGMKSGLSAYLRDGHAVILGVGHQSRLINTGPPRFQGAGFRECLPALLR